MTNKHYYFETFTALSIILLLFFPKSNLLSIIIYMFIFLSILLSKVNVSILIYIALLPWERTLTFQTSLSFLTLFQLAFLSKLFLNLNIIKPKITFLNILFMMFYLLLGVVSFYLTQNISGIGLSIDILIAVFLFYYIREKSSDNKNLFNNIKLTAILSLCLSMVYGIVYSLYSFRWIDGIGYAPFFRGVLESNETALYINIAILFIYSVPLNKIFKIIIFTFLVSVLLWTLSFTGLLVFVIVLTLVITFGIADNRKANYKNIIKLISLTILLIAFTYIMRDKIPMFHRVINVINDLMLMDFSSATSGRTDLLDKYVLYYKNLEDIQKIFGTSFRARDYIIQYEYLSFSHNTFLDLLFYMGWFGLILSLFYLISLIKRTFRYSGIIKEYAYLKIILIISGLSLSLSNYNFWFFWLLI